MKTKFYLDRRGAQGVSDLASDGDREYPVKIAINHGGSSAYIPTGVMVREGHWASKPGVGRVVKTPMASRLNIVLSEKKLEVDKAIERLRMDGVLHGMTASGIKTAVEKRLELERHGGEDGEIPVMACFEQFMSTKTREGTLSVYRFTLEKLHRYCGISETTTFREITPGWLASFDAFLAETSPSANARAIHLRNIRTVFNYALSEGFTEAKYPFRRFKIRTQPTRDRSLTPEQLKALLNAPCSPSLAKYRDAFFLSFFLCGMNLEDILALREIRGGRVETQRIKTGQPLTVRVEPEAMEIIGRHSGGAVGRLVSFGNAGYKNFQHRLNANLKRIGMEYDPHAKQWTGEPVIHGLTFYHARYSWATIAAELDIPERTIGAALGHSTARSVTSVYTRVDMRRKIDAANRAVIDTLLRAMRRDD